MHLILLRTDAITDTREDKERIETGPTPPPALPQGERSSVLGGASGHVWFGAAGGRYRLMSPFAPIRSCRRRRACQCPHS